MEESDGPVPIRDLHWRGDLVWFNLGLQAEPMYGEGQRRKGTLYYKKILKSGGPSKLQPHCKRESNQSDL